MAYSDDPTETELPKGVITLILPARMAQEYSRRSHMNPWALMHKLGVACLI